MRKRTKFMSLLAAAVMLFASSQCVCAATYNWVSTKTPGVSGIVVEQTIMPLYKGNIKFRVNQLYGNCNMLIAQTESHDDSLYYVNNAVRNIRITAPGGYQIFKLAFSSAGESEECMVFDCFVDHNANIGDLVYANGTFEY